MSKNILAVIQARSGSKDSQEKNIYPINGYPLISYTIAAANESQHISRLIVSTDSDGICRYSPESYGAEALHS